MFDKFLVAQVLCLYEEEIYTGLVKQSFVDNKYQAL